MNKSYFYIIIISVYCFLSGCNSHRDENTHPNTLTHTLSQYEDKVFPLDSLTAPLSPSVQYFEYQGKGYFCMLNMVDESIQFYDYETARLDFKVTPFKGGTHKLKGIVAFYIHAIDSIFVTDRYHTLALINRQAQIINTYPVESEIHQIGALTPGILAKTRHPMILHGTKLYLAGVVLGQHDHPMVIEIDLLKKEVNYVFRYPDRYQNGHFWQGYDYYYSTGLMSDKTIVYSFEADPNLYITNIAHREIIASVFAPSVNIDKIEAYYRNISDTKGAEFHHFNVCKSAAYGPIMYDPYRNCYYRMAFQSIDEATCQKGLVSLHIQGRVSIIILNHLLQTIGEVLLADKMYYVHDTFITAEGLHIAPMDQENEDELRFEVYQLTPIKNESDS